MSQDPGKFTDRALDACQVPADHRIARLGREASANTQQRLKEIDKSIKSADSQLGSIVLD